jgi:L-methionine (R)-S-oxide reductase
MYVVIRKTYKFDFILNFVKMDNKEELYKKAKEEINTRIATLEKGNIVPRMATIVAVLKNTMPHYFWCGFYFAEEKEMIAGPYQGPSACPNIGYQGVCGASAKKKETVVVPDVHSFPGHIACDARSNSEIVVPLVDGKGRIIAVFDVDSDKKDAFDEVDRKHLEEIMPLLLDGELN